MTSRERRRVCTEAELPPEGQGRAFTVGRKQVAIFNLSGKLYAIDDTCTHMTASLVEDGYVEDDEVECGLHGARFCIKTGEALCLPATESLQAYSVSVEAGGVWLVPQDLPD